MPPGPPSSVVRRRRLRRDRDGREAEAGRHRTPSRSTSRRSAIGGTWWDNTYPGAEVDVGSHLYCFSFKPHDWSRTHARQPELQKYLEETVDEFGLRPHLRLGVTVESATWDDDRHVWTVRLDDGTVDECHVLVERASASSTCPAIPTGPGSTTSRGPKFHTARWEHQHDLTGKVVAVVGTGSSATQVVPAIQPIVRAALRVPARARAGSCRRASATLTDDERAAFAQPLAAPARALAPAVPAREEPVARAALPAGHQDQRGAPAVLPRATSPASSPTAPTSARPSRRRTRIRASGRSSRARSIPRSRRTTWSWSRVPWPR